MAVSPETEWFDGITVGTMRASAVSLSQMRESFYIGLVKSSQDRLHTDEARIGYRLYCLLGLFNISTVSWQEQIVRAEGTYATGIGVSGEREYEREEVVKSAKGIGLGAFLINRAFYAIPIESDTELGHYYLGIRLEEGLVANLQSRGEQSISRIYIDPRTQEIINATRDELEELAEKGVAITDIEVSYENEFNVVFSEE